MKVTVEQGGPCRRVMKIEVPSETVATEYQAVVAKLAKQVRIPGFRPGKAPAAVIEKRLSKEALDETRERLVPRAYRQALEQEELQPVAIIDVSDIHVDKQLPLTFRVTVDVNPEFVLPSYKGVKVVARKVEVKEADVEQVIGGIRERAARLESRTGSPARRGDVVEIDYKGVSEGRPISEIAPENSELNEGKDFWVLLADGPEFLPGLAVQLEGIEIGQTREVPVTFQADYGVKAVAGRSAVYTVTAKGIRERILPELDAEFLKTMGVESVEALRARVSENLREAAEMTERNRQREDIVKWLLEHTEIKELPQSLVEEEARHIIHNVVQENVRRGASKEEIESHREDIFTRASQSSSDRVKMDFVLGRIADEEKIDVSEAEFDQRIRGLAARYGMSAQRLRADLEQRGAMDAIRKNLRMEKTVDAVLAAATVNQE